MKDRPPESERRLDRRIPLGCPAQIRNAAGQRFPAECVELSVSGMTLRSRYVPAELEEIEVAVLPPPESIAFRPLTAWVSVRRCHALGNGVFELGVATLRITG